MIGGGTARQVDRGLTSALQARAAARSEAPSRPLGAAAPDRYRIQEAEGFRTLICTEAPGMVVRLQQGVTWTAAAARRAPPGSIFLDGAAAGGPFLDPQRAVYNLDHHDGCIRPFTLSTCEQAIVLVRRIVDLRRRDWTLYANDADLDTVLAVWVLLNHLRLNGEDGRARRALMPLLRLESTIDAHGLDHLELCGLPSEALRAAWSWMQELRRKELSIKQQGRWRQVDLLEYLAGRLREIDALAYPPGTFEGVLEIEELARANIGERSVAVACRASEGIYEVERQLRRVHGERLGVIVLQTDRSTYSIRQVDPELPATLFDVYAELNLIDPASGGPTSPNCWGGSAEIGGSPRRSGTRLRSEQLVGACRHVYSPRGALARLAELGGAVGLAAGVVVGGLLAASSAASRTGSPVVGSAAFGLALFGCAALLALLGGRRARGLCGLRRGELRAALWVLPLAALGAAAGGVWLPPALDRSWWCVGASAALALGAEALFRGAVQGRLAWGLRTGSSRRLWSPPLLLAALLYAPSVLLPPIALAPLLPVPPELPTPGVAVAGAFAFGLAAGRVRQRSGSLLPALALHLAAAGVVLLVRL